MARAAGKLAVAGRACHPHRWGRRRPEALDSNGAARLGRTMASPMIPPPAAPEFLARSGWADADILPLAGDASFRRSEEHTSELQSLMRISYAVFCLKKKKKYIHTHNNNPKHIHS